METESSAPPTPKDKKAAESGSAESATTSSEKEKEAESEKSDQGEKREPEPNFQLLSNPARVLPQQVREMVGGEWGGNGVEIWVEMGGGLG